MAEASHRQLAFQLVDQLCGEEMITQVGFFSLCMYEYEDDFCGFLQHGGGGGVLQSNFFSLPGRKKICQHMILGNLMQMQKMLYA
jgi:hypothetical protein